MSIAYHCDSEDCDTWQRVIIEGGTSWFFVNADETGKEYHLCCGDCLLKWAGSWSVPTEIVDLDLGD